MPFDVVAYLESLGIKGETKSRGQFLYIQCPECDRDEPKLWINLGHPRYPQGCWRCWRNERHRGGPAALVMHLERVGYGEARGRVARFSTGEAPLIEEKEEREPELNEIEMPGALLSADVCGAAMGFLEKRGFDESTIRDWGLAYAPLWRYGDRVYKQRVFIPIYFGGRLVAFQARDVTGRQRQKYMTSPLGEGAALPLYNCDRVRVGLAVLVEGVMDAWAVGTEHALGLFGKALRPFQARLLHELVGPERVVVALDGDAYEEAQRIAMDLSPLFPSVDVLELPYGEDPASLGRERVWEELRKFEKS